MRPRVPVPIRIEYVIDHLHVGGAQRHLAELLARLDRDRFAPQVTVGQPGGALTAVIERLGVPVRPFGLGPSLARPHAAGALVRAARRLRAQGVVVVHGYLYLGNILAALAGRLAGTPIRLVSKRSLDRYPRRSQRLATRLANACAHRVVCNAEAVRRVVLEEEGVPPARCTVIANGIHVPAPMPAAVCAPGVPAGARVVGTVGRLTWKKAYAHFLEAAARIRAAHGDVEFVLVGDGPLRAALETQAARLGLGRHVHFLGEVADVRGLVRGFDVFVLSSVIEGMPNVLLEALALERPAVVTAAGGMPEIVAHETSGLVVPPGDPAALAAAVCRLLAAPAEAAAFAAAGRRTVETRFSVASMVDRYVTLYETLGRALGHPMPPASDAVDPARRVAGGRG
jgi:glycosyltransferase involved in cell wall biosynthesis